MFNTTQSKKSIIKFPVTLLQQILNASHVYLMKEINVCKIIRRKIYVVFYNTIFASANWCFISHISCTMYCTFHCVLSHCNFRVLHRCLRSLCYWSQILLIKWFNFVFTKDLPSVSQSVKHISCRGWKGRVIYLD